jgi:multicomponent Na+:H+ antiporter subunit B
MNSIILQIASRYVRVILLVFAVVALLRGHNHPGGGFIGGLLAGLSFVFVGFAYSVEVARKRLKVPPGGFIATGLILIFLSFLPGILKGVSLMQGAWIHIPFLFRMELKLGTPLLFDAGIFFAVIGVTVLFFFSMKREEPWR